MKQVSMKAEGGHGDGCHCCEVAPSGCGEPDYPWGLRITLTEDQIKALGIEALPAAGAPVGIEATGRVVSVSEEERDGKMERRIEIQITDLAVITQKKEMSTRMYPGDED